MSGPNNDRDRPWEGGLRVEQANETNVIVAPSVAPAQVSRLSRLATGDPTEMTGTASAESACYNNSIDARAASGADAGSQQATANRRRVPPAALRAVPGVPTERPVTTRARQTA